MGGRRNLSNMRQQERQRHGEGEGDVLVLCDATRSTHGRRVVSSSLKEQPDRRSSRGLNGTDT